MLSNDCELNKSGESVLLSDSGEKYRDFGRAVSSQRGGKILQSTEREIEIAKAQDVVEIDVVNLTYCAGLREI